MLKLSRLALPALFASLMIPLAMPVQAGPNELAFLQSLAGTWNGKGQVTGSEKGTVMCRLTLRPSGERLNFNGRCAYSGSGTPQSFSGRISFNDRKGVFESSSSGRTVAGKKSGSTLTFTTNMSDMRGRGVSTMSLSPRGIKVQFELVNSRTGEGSKGSIPFSKS